MRKLGIEIAVLVSFFAIGLSILIGVTVIQATMESRTYNRLTGARTTWWDALWVELRVMESTK